MNVAVGLCAVSADDDRHLPDAQTSIPLPEAQTEANLVPL